MARRWKIFAAVGGVLAALDQLTKYWAKTSLPTDFHGRGLPVPVIDGYFEWRLSYNEGSAFGLFKDVAGAPVFLTVIALVAVLAIGWMVKQAEDHQTRLVTALGLIVGGAVGNVIDRIAHGRVTDFVVWKYHEHEWPVFNVADAALCIGIGLMFLDVSREQRAERSGGEDGESRAVRERAAGSSE